MSESEAESSAGDIPPDAEIETCLRTIVREAAKKQEEVTVKLARTRAEEELGLDAGFLNDNAQWKQRSKDIITAAFEELETPVKPKTATKDIKANAAPKAGTKRKSDEAPPARKKAKKDTVIDSEDGAAESWEGSTAVDEQDEPRSKAASRPLKKEAETEDESALSDPPEEDEKPKTKQTNGNHVGEDDESELSSVLDDPPPKKKRQSKTAPKAAPKAKASKSTKAVKRLPAAADDESDLSSVIDDPPPKKSRKKKSPSADATSKAKAKAKPSTSSKALTADEEEIKRLQSWLLKCGVRKLWHRELANCDTDKQKIKHLKGMLEAVGMTGRYSAEKARGIKEKRELEAELEAATEFNKTWGRDKKGKEDGSGGEEAGSEGEEEKSVLQGRRAKPKGFVDFGDSDEGSE